MEQELRIKISEAIKEPFVGNYIFSNNDLTFIYDEAGNILRYISNERGVDLSCSDYELIFVALVNLSKEWNSEEESFFDYIYRRLLGNVQTGKVYTQITNMMRKLNTSGKIYMLNSYTKKYYATLCSHAFAPRSSIESFFEMCWVIYCNDLDQQYEKNDPILDLITQSLHNKFNSYGTNEDDFQIGSKVYSIRAGIRGLAIDEPKLMTSLLDSTMEFIHSLFNNEPIKLDKHINVLINNWWKQKETSFGIERARSHNRREHIITDYSQIKAKYISVNAVAKLIVPAIRLIDNFEYEPYIEIKVNGISALCERIETRGSGILMSTKQVEYELSKFPLKKEIDISIEIAHSGHVIYHSKETLNREFILFRDSKEVMSQDCLPGRYFLYTTSLDDMLQYPDDIHRSGQNTYSLKAIEGEILQSNNKTIFFISEKTNRDLYFFAKEHNDAIYRYKDEEYKVIDGELYIDVAPSFDIKDYGVRYEDSSFKLSEFLSSKVNGKIRYNISMLISVGEPQHITVFKYSDNYIFASINLIKFNNINIHFDKELYYGKGETGIATFKTEKYHVQNSFNITNSEVSIPLEDGEIALYFPILRWKIDDGEWQTQEKIGGIWYKAITNSSMLYIDLPKTMSCIVELNNSDILEQCGSSLEYKLGQTIYALKENTKSSLKYFMICIKTSSNEFYPISKIYYKEVFMDEPILMFAKLGQFFWFPTSFVGDADARFRLDIFNDKNTNVYTKELTTKKENLTINLHEDYYHYKVTLLGKGFLHKETELYSKDFIYGNEKNIKYKGKTFVIKEVMLFDKNQPTRVRTIYIDRIRYLGEKNNFDFYSGSLYIINQDGKKIYLNNMKNELNEYINVNPIRMEIKSENSCYIGYGLDINDEDFEFNDEFTLDCYGKTTICQKVMGQKTQGIDYFLFEVKKICLIQ